LDTSTIGVLPIMSSTLECLVVGIGTCVGAVVRAAVALIAVISEFNSGIDVGIPTNPI